MVDLLEAAVTRTLIEDAAPAGGSGKSESGQVVSHFASDVADGPQPCDLQVELGLARQKRRFPRKGTCLENCSFSVAAGQPVADLLRRSFPWCAEWQDQLKLLDRSYVEATQAGPVDHPFG